MNERGTGAEILLVEDNPNDVELILHVFQWCNLSDRVHVAWDGEEALNYIFEKNQRPRVILLDLKLPKVDGLEVLRRLRADRQLKRLPVVILTSSNEEKDVAASYDLGANSYVHKPVDFDEFSEAVRQLGLYWLILNQGTGG